MKNQINYFIQIQYINKWFKGKTVNLLGIFLFALVILFNHIKLNIIVTLGSS